MTFEIEVKNARIDGPQVPRADFEMLLRFVCDFVVRIAEIDIFREVEFPFVEFAAQLAAWFQAERPGNFDYESMESPAAGLIYFHRSDTGEWRVGSTLPGNPRSAAITTDELRGGVEAFLIGVPTIVDAFGVDVRRFLLKRP